MDLMWRKASYSTNQGNCVETATAAGRVAVRDSKDPEGGRLVVSARAWERFTASMKAGRRELR